MSLLRRMLSQCKKPSGRFGRFLARGMNFAHSDLTRWGLGFIDIASDIDALEEKNKGWFAVKCKKQEK
jgi:hypothetical protein